MNKKQGVIIGTLLVLIICAGVLATKLNNPLYVNGGESSGEKSAISFNNSKTANNTEAFAEAKLTRDQRNAQTLQTLKTLIDDKNVSQENRDDAAKKYTELAMNTNYESKIETTLKSKGYEDVMCSIEENKVVVTVKGKDKLTDKEIREIKNIVVGIAKTKEVEIETKK